MSRPAVLIVVPEPNRRKQLGQGLSRFGYELVLASNAEEGRRFARGLGPSVIVAEAAVPGFGDASILGELRRGGTRSGGSLRGSGATTRLVVVGEGQEGEQGLPDEVLYLAARGLEGSELVRRIRLVLVGWELGLEPDARLQSLVGDFSSTPALEVIRGLGRALASGRVLIEGAEVVLERGEVIAASAGAARGLKAFCRVGARSQGPFRVVLGRPGVHREIEQDLPDLIIRAIEDRVPDPPSQKARLEVQLGPDFFDTKFSVLQREILTAAQDRIAIGALLDRLPATDGEVLREVARLAELGVVAVREPESGVRVVTDSTGDLPARLARDHGIRVVPLMVRFGERIFRDGVDIAPRQFYELLEGGGDHPVSNPPTPGEFLQVYRDVVPERDVVSVHISSSLSETFNHARKAAEAGARELQAARRERQGPEPPVVEVVDSRQVSLGLGLLALFAARMAHRGLAATEIAGRLRTMGDRVQVLFVVDTLEYLARGGRIGKARAWVGALLGIKPILGVSRGEVVPVDRVRGGRAAHPRMLALFQERLERGRPVVGAIAHARAPDWADRLRGLLEKELDVREMLLGEMGPVVGTHAGPGTVGAALFQPTDEELELVRPL
ncbi:MAG TPA: DegV family protein [Thermoanaerobaculia bacterium]|nr:DegV family protein [Thermoanaerobaculia bacterium]